MDVKDFLNSMEKALFKGNSKKMREFFITIALIGIVIIVASNWIFGGSTKNDAGKEIKTEATVDVARILNTDDKDELQSKVESILSKINGAGKVSVLITYYSSRELIPAYDTKRSDSDIQEKDTSGGTRNTKKNDSEVKVVYEENQNDKKPLIVKEVQPQAKGVVVVADGANEPQVKESLVRSVQVLLDIPIQKIQVVQRGQG